MRGLIATITVLWLAGAAVGTALTGSFWLTLVSMAGLLVTAAMGVSLFLRPAAEAGSPAAPRAEVRLLPTGRRLADARPSEDAALLGRAA